VIANKPVTTSLKAGLRNSCQTPVWLLRNRAIHTKTTLCQFAYQVL